MDKKCTKYEAYFRFAGKEDFLQHLEECPDCKREYEKQEKLSELIKDSGAAYYKMANQRASGRRVVKAACILLVFLTLGLYGGFKVQQHSKYQQFLKANTETSVIAQEGLPVDEFGFFDYN